MSDLKSDDLVARYDWLINNHAMSVSRLTCFATPMFG
jgi:hypothetical protein